MGRALLPGEKEKVWRERKNGNLTNNEKFNQVLNSCAHPRRVYDALMAFAEPSVQQTDNMRQKSQIVTGKLLSFFDVPQGDQKPV